MRMTEIEYSNQPPVDGYGPGFFRVTGEVIEGALLLTPAGHVDWAGLKDAQTLVEIADIDILFIGTGAEIAPLPPRMRKALEGAEVPYDVMSSASACRTYNVLLSEGRRVALAVLPV